MSSVRCFGLVRVADLRKFYSVCRRWGELESVVPGGEVASAYGGNILGAWVTFSVRSECEGALLKMNEASSKSPDWHYLIEELYTPNDDRYTDLWLEEYEGDSLRWAVAKVRNGT